MAVSRDSIVILHIVRERDCYKPIDKLVEKSKTSIGPSLFQCSPSKFVKHIFLFFLTILSRSCFDHHLRCVGWLNFEFSKREKHSGWAIKTFYKKLNRGMLKHIPLNQ